MSRLLILSLLALESAIIAVNAHYVEVVPRGLTVPTSLPSGWSYLGCYNDTIANRALYGGYKADGTTLTDESCINFCIGQGFTIAGTEYSSECFCDNTLHGGSIQQPVASCNMPCPGNTAEPCGGPNRLTVFTRTVPSSISSATSSSTTSAPSNTAHTTQQSTTISTSRSTTVGGTGTATNLPAGWSYGGCWIDNANGRIMNNEQPDNSAVTIESCIATCTNLGYQVAGLEYSVQCFCDNELRNGAALASSNSACSMACGGSSTEVCGGPNLVSVYSDGNFSVYGVPTIQKTGLPGQWQYQGCLQDNVGGVRTFPYQLFFPNTNNATTCLSLCSDYGYGAAGMEYGDECYCGDVSDIPSGAKIVSDSQCNMGCSGDPSHYCGAGNLLVYYTWSGYLQQWSYPTGNAAGEYQFLIGGVVVPLMTTLLKNGKITFLEKRGTGAPNTTGAYEFDPFHEDNFDLAWRAMHVETDIFCSAGLVLPDIGGRQLTVGGWSGVSTFGVRLYWPDGSPGVNGTRDWQENPDELQLQNGRWYPSSMIMSNGSILVVGGESGSNAPPVPTIEILPKVGGTIYMEWLNRTDPYNLYPFMTVLPSGGIFVAYWNESRILDAGTFDTIRELPSIPGAVNNAAGGRTYPLEGTMVLFPQYAPYTDPLTVMLCGGSTPFGGVALDNCVSTQPDVANAPWTLERMPSKRVISAMVPLPDGTFLILNGCHAGVAGFGLGSDPNFNAVLYDPTKPVNQRMSVMANTTIARMYHNEAILMQDGRVLVSGSDPQDSRYPEEYRVEVFLPPYILSGAARPTFTIQTTDWAYSGTYQIQVTSGSMANIKISLLGMVSATHGNSFGARTFFPAFSCSGTTCTITAPPNAKVCPPGWFMIFVLDGPTPSNGTFIRIGGDPASLGNWPQFPDFTVPGVVQPS